jgi:hypothetical protein
MFVFLFSIDITKASSNTDQRKSDGSFETISGTFVNLPKFLRETSYRNVSDSTHCPWHLAHNTTQSPFLWLRNHPADMDYFLTWMTAQREGMPTWLEVFPFEKKLCQNLEPETPLFVDIGGGVGHQCLALKDKHSQVSGRVILQDLPQVIEQAMAGAGIEPMAYDFWTPQPIKGLSKNTAPCWLLWLIEHLGARAYYMRNIMHDWPDDACIKILQNTMSAMTADSVILIDEMIIPETNAHWRATQLDITLMACLAAQERTKKQWHRLLKAAGLDILDIYTYTAELQDSIIVAAPQKS